LRAKITLVRDELSASTQLAEVRDES